jgi:membrane-associated HD superfamily phosphohydrolase
MGYNLLGLIALIVMVVIGLVILIFVVKLVLMFIPTAIVAFVVWFLTHSLWWAGIAFLVIAVLSIARKI